MAVSGKKTASYLSLGSEEDLKLFCQPCDREGPRLPAFGFCKNCNEHLCQSCYNHHKKATPSRHHVLLDKDAMPKTQQSSTPDHDAKPGDFTLPCLKHKKKMIEFYCRDHRVTLCSVCVTLEHTGKACKVDYIPDVSAQTIDSKEFKNITGHLDALIQHCQEVKEESKKVTEKSNTSLTEVLREIKKYREEINKRIDELENEVENTAKTHKQQNNQRLKNIEAICDDVTKSVKALSNNIIQRNMAKQADQLFIDLKTAPLEIEEHETCIKELVMAEDIKEYHFRPNQSILTALKSETSMGTLEEKILFTKEKEILNNKNPLGESSLKAENEMERKPKMNEDFLHTGKICVYTQSDASFCDITGMALLQPNQLVAADSSNMSIKLICLNSRTVTSQITLHRAPWDVTKVSTNEVAATQPFGRMIQFLSVSSKELSVKQSLKVNGKCRGISYFQENLVVSFDHPARIEILDMKGTVLTEISSNANGERLFKCPNYVEVNSHSIYVSDSDKATVMKLNWHGQVTGRFTDLRCNKGLSLSPEGTLFVCDLKRDRVVELSGDCKNAKIVSKCVNMPYSVCWCKETSSLYVSCECHAFSEEGNFIYIFNK